VTSLSEYVEIVKILWPSLAAAAAVTVGAGVVGVFVLLRREALVALAMPQVVAVGAAIGIRLGWPTLPPAIAAVAVAVVLLAWSKRRGGDAWVLPALYVAGLSLSFLIIANHGQAVEELQNLFTGIDVAVSPGQAMIAVPVLVATGILCALLWRRWLLLAQAPATAEVAGLRPARWETAFLCLLAIVLVVGTADLGAVMVVATLFLPAATVLPWARRIPVAMVFAVAAGIVFLLAGTVVSIEGALPLSQSVGGVGFAALVLSHGLAAVVS
jgi:ABC-type Mn2+/Zn2+ transport system permease subunit